MNILCGTLSMSQCLFVPPWLPGPITLYFKVGTCVHLFMVIIYSQSLISCSLILSICLTLGCTAWGYFSRPSSHGHCLPIESSPKKPNLLCKLIHQHHCAFLESRSLFAQQTQTSCILSNTVNISVMQWDTTIPSNPSPGVHLPKCINLWLFYLCLKISFRILFTSF